MRILFLADRVSVRGGADHYLLQMLHFASRIGHRVQVAAGRFEVQPSLPEGIECQRIRGLSSSLDTGKGLTGLEELISGADVVHLQNVMNPTAIRIAVSKGHAVATVQDHRIFCPGMGKTMPDGSRCTTELTHAPCATCLPEDQYREVMLKLTSSRQQALSGARLVVLSHYMAEELDRIGLPKAEVLPPWVAPAKNRGQPGNSLFLGGRLVSHKGVISAWNAWNEAGRTLPFRIAGSGPLEERLEGTTKLGWLSQEALTAELLEARALLFPAFWQEPFGILGIQALAVGTPVIVTDSGGTSDWSHAGSIRVPAGDSRAFLEAIDNLSHDPALAQRLGREGQVMTRERFGFGPWARGLETIWAKAMAI